MSARFRTWGFDGWGDYAATLRGAYRGLRGRALAPQEALEAADGPPLPKTMTWLHVSCLGVGLILGAGAEGRGQGGKQGQLQGVE
jgi:hypothetical protein